MSEREASLSAVCRHLVEFARQQRASSAAAIPTLGWSALAFPAMAAAAIAR